jgi:phosphonate metabolism protein PhnN/1,5-bisphosphokinase (PRPP-forming)
MAGTLVLVVGPSGAGKDTLISAAMAELAGDPRFSFPRRTVTRAAQAAIEDHDSIGLAEFQQQKLRGAYALDWEAHGLSYGIPAAIDATLAAGRIVVANVSRRVIAHAIETYPKVAVIAVGAAPEILAARLAARGREDGEQVASRLRRPAPGLPAGTPIIEVDNSGRLDDGVRAFLEALRRVADEP